MRHRIENFGPQNEQGRARARKVLFASFFAEAFRSSRPLASDSGASKAKRDFWKRSHSQRFAAPKCSKAAEVVLARSRILA